LEEWDEGDLHRLVSAFLGVRFPIALALNKIDVPSSQQYVCDIQAELPIHGTHIGTPLSAKSEMMYVRHFIERDLLGSQSTARKECTEMAIPRGTLACLQSAMSLCTPVLAFPVVDHQSYAPLPGLLKFATGDPSLPTSGMISCLHASGGTAPSEWDASLRQYAAGKSGKSKGSTSGKDFVVLRDVIVLKPGSTVNDLFVTLKRMGALSGEFVRAEAAGDIGCPAKPIPKFDVISRQTRILKIMTNKRTAWQRA
jgi:ribosome-binding ATPase